MQAKILKPVLLLTLGSSRSGKISGELELLEYGDASITLDLNFDNILKVV